MIDSRMSCHSHKQVSVRAMFPRHACSPTPNQSTAVSYTLCYEFSACMNRSVHDRLLLMFYGTYGCRSGASSNAFKHVLHLSTASMINDPMADKHDKQGNLIMRNAHITIPQHLVTFRSDTERPQNYTTHARWQDHQGTNGRA
jgi:hypothetical protein